MNTPRRSSLAILATLAGVMLTGCISVFPKESPAQLYRFGADFTLADRPSPPASNSFGVQAISTSFDRAAAGDAILTVTGEQAAYIKGSRWVAPATTLFDAAVARAFDASPGPARLIPRGEITRPEFMMKLDVRAFEARYESGPGTAPTVVVEVYAALTRVTDRSLVGERIFQASVPTHENRAGAIAGAFDQATGQVLSKLVGWVNNRGAG